MRIMIIAPLESIVSALLEKSNNIIHEEKLLKVLKMIKTLTEIEGNYFKVKSFFIKQFCSRLVRHKI